MSTHNKHKSFFFLPLLVLAAAMLFTVHNCGDNGAPPPYAKDGGNVPDGGPHDGGIRDGGPRPDGGQREDGGIRDGGITEDGGDAGIPEYDDGGLDGGPDGGIPAPDGGCDGAALSLINEVNQKITYGFDLIELKVVRCGNVNGILVQLNPGMTINNHRATLATLPNLMVETGDFIVIHMGPTTDGGVMPVVNETNLSGKTGCPESDGCYDSAWDIVGNADAIPNSERVLAVGVPGLDGGMGTIQDAVPFIIDQTPANSFLLALQYIQQEGQWSPADCDGGPCNNSSNPTASSISVDWSDCGNTTIGKSMQRKTTADTDKRDDWFPAPSKWGAENINP